jgi:hypothetical protein
MNPDPDSDPEADPDPAIFVINLQDATKKLIKKMSAPYFLKSNRSRKTVGIKVFLTIFA